MKIKIGAVLFFSLFAIKYVVSQSCLTDAGCQNCSKVNGTNTFSCTQCKSFYQYNTAKKMCTCIAGYYQSTKTMTCEQCASPCLTCSTNQTCTSCVEQNFRMLSKGSCVCKSGYQEKDGVCVQPANIFAIVFSIVGGLGFLIMMIYIGKVWCKCKKDDVESQHNDQHQMTNQEKQARHQTFLKKIEEGYKNDITCSICLDDSTLALTQCSHYFHERCIGNWIFSKNPNSTCPNCNSKIDFNKIHMWCRKCKKNPVKFHKEYICRDNQEISLTKFEMMCGDCQNKWVPAESKNLDKLASASNFNQGQ